MTLLTKDIVEYDLPQNFEADCCMHNNILTKTANKTQCILLMSIASYIETCGETVATKLVAAMAEPEVG